MTSCGDESVGQQRAQLVMLLLLCRCQLLRIAPFAAPGAKAAIAVPCVALPIPATAKGEALATTVGAAGVAVIVIVAVDGEGPAFTVERHVRLLAARLTVAKMAEYCALMLRRTIQTGAETSPHSEAGSRSTRDAATARRQSARPARASSE